MTTVVISQEDRETYFAFLNEIRESGKINMFAAAAPLAEMFDLDKKTAKEVLLNWMENFKE